MCIDFVPLTLVYLYRARLAAGVDSNVHISPTRSTGVSVTLAGKISSITTVSNLFGTVVFTSLP